MAMADVESSFADVSERLRLDLVLIHSDEKPKTFCADGGPLRCFTSNTNKDYVKRLYALSTPTPIRSIPSEDLRTDDEAAGRFWEAVVGKDIEEGADRKSAAAVILAILLHIDVKPTDAAWRRYVQRCLARPRALQDRLLPFDSFDDIEDMFGDEDHVAAKVYQKQWIFCPLALEWDKEVVLFDHHANHRRMPWVSETRIGQGAFGSVYKVKIAGHENGWASSNGYFARKDVRVKPGQPSQDWLMAEYFRNRIDGHKRIMKFRAAVRTPERVSLIFDLAKCDLDQYLSNPDTYNGFSVKDKMHLFCQMVDLVGALKFLHSPDGFKDHEGRPLSFHHLDLKPENILVVPEEHGGKCVDVFKITDFGISAMVNHGSNRVVDLKAQYGQRDGQGVASGFDQHAAAATAHVGDNAMCLPPEALKRGERKQKVNAMSDVWSIGCVMAVFLVWLYGGPEAYNDFVDTRLRHGDKTYTKVEDGFEKQYQEPINRRFFTFAVEDDARLRDYQIELRGEHEEYIKLTCKLFTGVEQYFSDMCTAVGTRVRKLREMYQMIWGLLHDHVLVPNPRERIDMRSLHVCLEGIAKEWAAEGRSGVVPLVIRALDVRSVQSDLMPDAAPVDHAMSTGLTVQHAPPSPNLAPSSPQLHPLDGPALHLRTQPVPSKAFRPNGELLTSHVRAASLNPPRIYLSGEGSPVSAHFDGSDTTCAPRISQESLRGRSDCSARDPDASSPHAVSQRSTRGYSESYVRHEPREYLAQTLPLQHSASQPNRGQGAVRDTVTDHRYTFASPVGLTGIPASDQMPGFFLQVPGPEDDHRVLYDEDERHDQHPLKPPRDMTSKGKVSRLRGKFEEWRKKV